MCVGGRRARRQRATNLLPATRAEPKGQLATCGAPTAHIQLADRASQESWARCARCPPAGVHHQILIAHKHARRVPLRRCGGAVLPVALAPGRPDERRVHILWPATKGLGWRGDTVVEGWAAIQADIWPEPFKLQCWQQAGRAYGRQGMWAAGPHRRSSGVGGNTGPLTGRWWGGGRPSTA